MFVFCNTRVDPSYDCTANPLEAKGIQELLCQPPVVRNIPYQYDGLDELTTRIAGRIKLYAHDDPALIVN